MQFLAHEDFIYAARNGADTVLIERFGSLGGINTNGFMFVSGKFGGVATEIMDRLQTGGYVADCGKLYPAAYYSRLTH